MGCLAEMYLEAVGTSSIATQLKFSLFGSSLAYFITIRSPLRRGAAASEFEDRREEKRCTVKV